MPAAAASLAGLRKASASHSRRKPRRCPIILVSFGRLAILSPVVNLVVVPLVAPAMAAGVVALAGGGLALAGAPPVIGAIIAAPGWVILRVLVAIVDAAAGLPFASVTLEPPFDVVAAASSTLALAGLVWSRRTKATDRQGGPAGSRADPSVGTVAAPRRRAGASRRPRSHGAPGRRRVARRLAARRRCGRRRDAGRRRPDLRPRCRAGRRHPRRGFPRRPAPHRRRTRS